MHKRKNQTKQSYTYLLLLHFSLQSRLHIREGEKIHITTRVWVSACGWGMRERESVCVCEGVCVCFVWRVGEQIRGQFQLVLFSSFENCCLDRFCKLTCIHIHTHPYKNTHTHPNTHPHTHTHTYTQQSSSSCRLSYLQQHSTEADSFEG